MENTLIILIIAVIVQLIIIYFIIQSATKSNKIVAQNDEVIKLLNHKPMKKYLLILVLIMPSIAFAQNIKKPDLKPSYEGDPATEFVSHKLKALESCWGIPFGTTRDSIIKMVKKKSGKIPKQTGEKGVLIYENCSFGSSYAKEITLLFVDGLFYGSYVVFKPENTPSIFDLYKQIKGDITEKYFKPQSDVESYKYPYEKGDGHVSTAILTGHATISSIWEFARSEKTRGSGMIVLVAENNGTVGMHYRDGFLSKLAEMDLSKQMKDDY